MSKYLLTSAKFEGSITYGFSEGGLLNHFEIAVHELTTEQHTAILQHLRYGLDRLTFLEWAAKYKYTLTELLPDLSYTFWYNLFDMKRNKEKAMPYYEPCNDATRIVIIHGTRAYKRYCHRNKEWYNQMYPDTFLKGKHYLDEWDKM